MASGLSSGLSSSSLTSAYRRAQNRNPLMGEHPSYHQSMSAEEAEQRLKKYDGDCCYLTRFCEADRKYMLSVSQKRPTQSIKHFQIEIQDGKYYSIFEREEVFDDITELLEYYEQNRLDPAFKTIGRMFTEDDYTKALNKTLMEEHTSYHQTISAEEAEQRLEKCGRDQCYLTRYCEADRKYMLSVSQKSPTQSIKHFQIHVRDGKCNIHEKPDVFDDITQMLQHYECNRLDSAFKTIGKMFTEYDYTIALKMEEHTSYHKTISTAEAERRLKKCGRDRCYLTRYCDKDKNYVLSVQQKISTRVKHFKIEVRNGKCNIHNKPDVFDDITQMLEHYEHNKLNSAFENIGTRCTEENYNSSKYCQIL